LFKVHAEVLG
jgi:hypothetical protein